MTSDKPIPPPPPGLAEKSKKVKKARRKRDAEKSAEPAGAQRGRGTRKKDRPRKPTPEEIKAADDARQRKIDEDIARRTAEGAEAARQREVFDKGSDFLYE